ncbi:MAG: prepilin-type N-terminal cleavage/methylation domain-containing protein, partial [Symbiobacteriaceae bacterium]|nr:prepilin-type N-terminal cleavage/methylation domain-containing protein [Symbiobacteriaceae bacterium]
MVFIRGKLNRKATTKGKDQGFTLVEVMVVAAILVLLAGVAVPQLFKSFEDARKQKLEVDAKQIQV